MGFKYYPIPNPPSSASTILTNEFYALIEEQFSIATDVFDIKEESVFASGSLTDVTVRVVTAVDPATNERLSDDFKTLLFKPSHAVAKIGYKYYFENSFWVGWNSSSLKSLVNNIIVRRCNNYLRFIDENGNYYSEPCAIPPEIRQSNDSMGLVNPVTPGGFIYAYAQQNVRTRKIKANQRFLFGNTDNWISFKVIGNGVRNFLNLETASNNTCQLLELIMERNYDNQDNDDLVNGIANYYNNIYALTVIPTTITGNVADTFQITPSITKNSDPIDMAVTYATSASSIASVSGSGLITLLTSGSCNITCYVTSNTSASTTIPVTVSASAIDNYEVRVDPNPDFILEGETKTYDVKLYLNGTVQADTFTFALNDANVPTSKYTLVAPVGNTIVLTNNHYYLDYPLVINCVSGSNNRQLSILLRGGW